MRPGKRLAHSKCCYFLDPALEPAVPFVEAGAAMVFGFSFLEPSGKELSLWNRL